MDLKNYRIGVGIIIILCSMGCATSPNFEDTPTLEFRSFSKSQIRQGEFNDSLVLELFFTDGDGNFGASTTSNDPNIFLKDVRTGIINSYKAPFIPSQGANNGVKGKILILLKSTCCIYPPITGIDPCESVDDFPSNQLAYEIFISDRSGNQSAPITTPSLTLLCTQ